MYDPSDRVELPYQAVRQKFIATCTALGCPETEAMTIGQCVWHLCNRGLDGVDYTLRYLAALAADASLSRFAVAPLSVEMSQKLNSGDRRTSAFLGCPAPLLLLPAASFRLDETAETDGILFTFNDQTVVYSKSHGLRILSNQPQGLMDIDPLDVPTCTGSRVDYLDGTGQGIEFPRQKLETLAVPKSVLLDDSESLSLAPLLA